MAEVVAAPSMAMEVDGLPQIPIEGAPVVAPPVPAQPEAPAVPEHVSETLYIQNLNENIRIPGTCLLSVYQKERLMRGP